MDKRQGDRNTTFRFEGTERRRVPALAPVQHSIVQGFIL